MYKYQSLRCLFIQNIQYLKNTRHTGFSLSTMHTRQICTYVYSLMLVKYFDGRQILWIVQQLGLHPHIRKDRGSLSSLFGHPRNLQSKMRTPITREVVEDQDQECTISNKKSFFFSGAILYCVYMHLSERELKYNLR